MSDLLNRLAIAVGLPRGVVGVLAVLGLLLLVGSAIRGVWLLSAAARREEVGKRLGSLAVWWVLFALLVSTALLGRYAAAALFAVTSLLGLHEFHKLAQARIATVRFWWLLAALSVPLHYLLLYLEGGAFSAIVPVWGFLILAGRLVATGQIANFLETAGITFLGLMLTVFLFSHAVMLFTLPESVNLVGGAVGLFVFLLTLTEVNDIAQALWGRLLGRRKITPTVSPNKTWEGFLLGGATTTTLSVILAGWITPFTTLPAIAAGLLIAIGGFFGDITMSAIKREVGVKDSGDLLPGQGGVLDRIDSLTFTGPLFYYFVYLFYRGAP